MFDTETGSVSGLSRRQFLALGAGAALGAVLGAGDKVANANSARIIRHVYTNARKVCLTYDDLWSEYYTLRIAREYSRRNVGLTLFPAGLAVKNNLNRPHAGYENLYPRLRDMGHEFGCHLFTHRDIRNFGLQQLIDEEMEPSLHVMRRALGPAFQPVGLRPPYGVVTDAVQELSARYGIPLILWGLDSQDAICTKQSERDDCACEPLPSFLSYASVWGPDPSDVMCSQAQCLESCIDTIVNNYEYYLRPGTIILHHTLKAALLAIPSTLRFLRAWNMQPIRFTELLHYAS